MYAMTPDSTYAKSFLMIPEQIRRLRGRGMDCGSDAYAAEVLERYGYYRLSGYWYLYRDRPAPPARRFDEEGREVRLDTFVSGTSLAHVVSLYEFDHALRVRLSDSLSMIETAFRFFIGHRLGRVDAFAHRHPWALDATRQGEAGALPEPTTAYREWLDEYDRHEKRARDDFVLHFREKYGPHLPIWVATELMSFGLLSRLYGLMLQSDQEILAARFQIRTAEGHGDRGALGNWLNSLRHVRNICAHYGRAWNRAFDVTIVVPGQAQRNIDDPLAPLVDDGTNNRLYGVLLVMRHLLLSIAPERGDLVDLVDFIEEQSRVIGFGMEQLGFPDDWRSNPIWDRSFALDRSPMVSASLLDRVECMTAAEVRASLMGAEVLESDRTRIPVQAERAKKAAQRNLLRSYLKHGVVIEVELGKAKFYPAFQFRDGKIIDALAKINKELASSCSGAESIDVARALLDWWQTPHPDLPRGVEGSHRSPIELLNALPEEDFAAVVRASEALKGFIAPDFASESAVERR